jgi:hypothetical protein
MHDLYILLLIPARRYRRGEFPDTSDCSDDVETFATGRVSDNLV